MRPPTPARAITRGPESDRPPSAADDLSVRAIGHVRSSLHSREEAPRQGSVGAPDAWLELDLDVRAGLEGIAVGDEVIVLTWFHQSRRDVLKLHPRGDPSLPITGVFATRSPDRPNPIGLHRVRVLEVAGSRIKVGPLEAIDGTPIVDIKPVLPIEDH
jgi:tRNA-Thr(GGU) m(6)t(6)A37 methyltransferase TsaA